MGGGTPAYAVSKAALNALTRMLGRRPPARPACSSTPSVPAGPRPTWAARGGRPVAEGAASILWAVDLPDDGPTGTFTRDGRPVPW